MGTARFDKHRQDPSVFKFINQCIIDKVGLFEVQLLLKGRQMVLQCSILVLNLQSLGLSLKPILHLLLLIFIVAVLVEMFLLHCIVCRAAEV